MSGEYLISRINVRYGKVDRFNAVMEEFVPIFEAQGWRLVASYRSVIGSLTEVLDIWEVDDAAAVSAARRGAADHPDFARLAPQLNEIIESEMLTLAVKMPFSP